MSNESLQADTSESLVQASNPTSHASVPPTDAGSDSVVYLIPNGMLWLALWATWLIGLCIITFAYNRALVDSGTSYYPVFWIGISVALFPSAVILLVRRLSRVESLLILVVDGLISFLPKLLMSLNGPRYHDELFHWKQANQVVAQGKLFQSNSGIYIIKYYPGLHSLTAAIHFASGLSVWRSGQVLIGLIHCLTLLAIYFIAEEISGNEKVGGLAAFLYILSPNFVYFDTQYSYESLGLPLALVVIYAQVRIIRSDRASSAHFWWITGTFIGAGCIVTHHLSAAF